jgi:hypothetical protein
LKRYTSADAGDADMEPAAYCTKTIVDSEGNTLGSVSFIHPKAEYVNTVEISYNILDNIDSTLFKHVIFKIQEFLDEVPDAALPDGTTFDHMTIETDPKDTESNEICYAIFGKPICENAIPYLGTDHEGKPMHVYFTPVETIKTHLGPWLKFYKA